MKKHIITVLIAISLIITSCADKFLETENLFEKNDENFYANANDINDALISAYACLAPDVGKEGHTLIAILLSDDCFSGGRASTSTSTKRDIDEFTNSAEDTHLGTWSSNYKGIFRTNMLIKRFDNAVFDSDEQKTQLKGEIYFLRAMFYFRLVKFFGKIPLITDPAPVSLPQASADEVFDLIASDLKFAIETMPATKFQSISEEKIGHATKWAAQGLMARVFLYYTGYYNKTEIALTDGSSITKATVINWIDDCVVSSGHELTPDFRNIWPYAYANVDYPYAANNNLSWIGEDKENLETMFAVKYSAYGGFNLPNKLNYCNQLALYVGIRAQSNLMPFGEGWGYAPVNPQLWESFEDGDIRKKGSIIDMNDPEEGVDGSNDKSAAYISKSNQSKHESGYFIKKHVPIQTWIANEEGTPTLTKMFYNLYGGTNDFQLANMQDEILLRFSDILLMGAELGSTKAQEYFDAVRARAGLAPKTISLDNIKAERHHEFAFEGMRYFDLQRWGDAEAAFAKVKDIELTTEGLLDKYTATYEKGKEFLAIPESQIRLSNGLLEQHDAWK